VSDETAVLLFAAFVLVVFVGRYAVGRLVERVNPYREPE
jgi:hypothetical protein